MLASFKVSMILSERLLLKRQRFGRWSRRRKCISRDMKTSRKLQSMDHTVGVMIACSLTHTSAHSHLNLNLQLPPSRLRSLYHQLNLMCNQPQNLNLHHPNLSLLHLRLRVSQLLHLSQRPPNQQLHHFLQSLQGLLHQLPITILTTTNEGLLSSIQSV